MASVDGRYDVNRLWPLPLNLVRFGTGWSVQSAHRRQALKQPGHPHLGAYSLGPWFELQVCRDGFIRLVLGRRIFVRRTATI